MAARSSSMAAEDDYETEQKKQAAADVLFHYSQFVMVCIGEDVRPTDLSFRNAHFSEGASTGCFLTGFQWRTVFLQNDERRQE
ncbi:uncharacterized protein [Miscanthus floridulus]|uniref:uncharacterized protein isoform X2 n=1 Tax=Miscanthus floridulus TaxID=154761 RepID=UPI00345A2AD8